MRNNIFCLLVCMLTIAFTACEPQYIELQDKKDNNNYYASATTLSATDITASSAVLHGKVSVENSSFSSIEFGILIAKTQSDISSHTGQRLKSSKQVSGEFSVKISGLSPKTTYYYQTYLILDKSKVSFGESKQFVTKSNSSGQENGHDYVDLGLSVKWATMNVGASSPERYGHYFAWGETNTKSIYSWSTYKWCNGTYKTLTKYCIDSDHGKVDNKTILDFTDDAAHVNWGGRWRMPTWAEMTELLNKCTWTWTSQQGVMGYEIKSSNGNSIFLPASGCYSGTNIIDTEHSGYYWSSSLSDRYSLARYTYFMSNKKYTDHIMGRYYGMTVRAVCP